MRTLSDFQAKQSKHWLQILVTVTLFLSAIGNSFAAFDLDDFASSSPALSRSIHNGINSTTIVELGLPILGGARNTYFRVYDNPDHSISSVVVGEGRVSVAQGTNAKAETLISYGAFTGNGLLSLDLTAYTDLRFEFAAAEDSLNVNVVYYTSIPLDPRVPRYYSSAGVNVSPVYPGGPLSFTLPVSNNPNFNWASVDGIVVIINRSGPIPHTSYTLDKLIFEP